eukprot:gene33322-40308_t
MEFVESKKRKLEGLSELDTEGTPHQTPAAVEVLETPQSSTSSSVENKQDSANLQSSSTGHVAGSGFSAYAKLNPFAMASKNTSFGLNISGEGSSNLRPNFTMPAPLTLPSPKSPKANPFSSPSPVHNPFMTIVESKDDLWKAMAKDKLSDEEVAKTSLFEQSAKKARTSKFGYGFGMGNGEGFGFGSALGSGFTTVNDSASTASSFLFAGNQSAAEQPEDEDDAADEDDNNNSEPTERPPSPTYQTYALPENAVVVTGEEGEECLAQMRVKLFRLNVKTPITPKISAIMTLHSKPDTSASGDSVLAQDADGLAKRKVGAIVNEQAGSIDQHDEDAPAKANSNSSSSSSKDPAASSHAEWVEVGIGPLKILLPKSPSDSAGGSQGKKAISRLVMRREDKVGGIGTKLLLNVRLDQYASVAQQSDKTARLGGVSYTDDSASMSTYLIKTKTGQECSELVQLIKDLLSQDSA